MEGERDSDHNLDIVSFGWDNGPDNCTFGNDHGTYNGTDCRDYGADGKDHGPDMDAHRRDFGSDIGADSKDYGPDIGPDGWTNSCKGRSCFANIQNTDYHGLDTEKDMEAGLDLINNQYFALFGYK